MFDVFTEEIEVLIKDGIANLYWYKADLHKAWLRSGVPEAVCKQIACLSDIDGGMLSKRKQMDVLYEKLRDYDYSRRLEISRNFVRILAEHSSFVSQNEKHKIDIAERVALKLRELIRKQNEDREYAVRLKTRAEKASKEDYHSQRNKLADQFSALCNLPQDESQKRGFSLERLFSDLMKISGIPVEDSFRVDGEQIDGAIKYDGHYYLIELKWVKEKICSSDIGKFYFKAEGKLEARGIMVAMNGYSDDIQWSCQKGKPLKVLLLDGNHLANVIYGQYTFQELLEHALSQASYKGLIYCGHSLSS